MEEQERKLRVLQEAVANQSPANVAKIAESNHKLAGLFDSASGRMPILLAASRGYAELVQALLCSRCAVEKQSQGSA